MNALLESLPAWQLLLAVLIATAAGAVLLILLVRRLPGYRRHLAERAKAASEQAGRRTEYARVGLQVRQRLLGGLRVDGALSGRAFRYRAVPRSKNSPARTTLATRSDLHGDFAVSREGRSDRWFKSLGLAREAQTGDAAFDDAYYLAGRAHDYVRALFAEEANRDAVHALFALGFDRVELHRGTLTLTRDGFAELLDLATLEAALDGLAALRGTPGTRHTAMQGLGGLSSRQLKFACTGLAVLAGLGYAACLAVLQPLLDGPFAPLLDAWRPALFAYLGLHVLAVLALRGRAAFATELAALVLLGLPALAALALEGALLGNQLLDSGDPQVVQAPLVGRYHVSGKNPSSHLLFADWRRPGARIDVTVTRAVHGRARQGETWRLQVRPGRLGYAWIEALAPVAAR
ncbi:MAG TPA: hypothetical protein VIX81_04645 [Gammaproteobacteria bacterium]